MFLLPKSVRLSGVSNIWSLVRNANRPVALHLLQSVRPKVQFPVDTSKPAEKSRIRALGESPYQTILVFGILVSGLFLGVQFSGDIANFLQSENLTVVEEDDDIKEPDEFA